MKGKALVTIICIICLIVGIAGSVFIQWKVSADSVNEVLDVEILESDSDKTVSYATGVAAPAVGTISVHFLELGNKYTGDCTYIKVGTDIDILIDCGSKSNSVPIVTEYLNKYVTDNTLEYVIVTHAHQDHYAGFATPENVNSIFDNFECNNIITFARTNQKSQIKASNALEDVKKPSGILDKIVSKEAGKNKTKTMYDYFLREVSGEVQKGATFYTAQTFREVNTNGIVPLDSVNNINMQILYHDFYEADAKTENNYSVCMQLTQGSKKFLFTGDLEDIGEQSLVNRNDAYLGQVEVYKAGHHGSKTSSSDVLLNVIQPKIVCVCCCAGSKEYTKNVSNQFPTVDFLKRISPWATQVYVTTLCIDYDKNEFTSFNGNIVVMSGKEAGSEVSVYCSNNNTILKNSEWYKQNRYELCKTAGIAESWL